MWITRETNDLLLSGSTFEHVFYSWCYVFFTWSLSNQMLFLWTGDSDSQMLRRIPRFSLQICRDLLMFSMSTQLTWSSSAAFTRLVRRRTPHFPCHSVPTVTVITILWRAQAMCNKTHSGYGCLISRGYNLRQVPLHWTRKSKEKTRLVNYLSNISWFTQ